MTLEEARRQAQGLGHLPGPWHGEHANCLRAGCLASLILHRPDRWEGHMLTAPCRVTAEQLAEEVRRQIERRR